MEESDLMKERLLAITERHRIQEQIRRKKLELDQEKLKLQHLKKKSLREQWLLLDSSSQNATEWRTHQRQEIRELQLTIHRLEKEVEFLEREESMITTNEGFILNRLKAVERSSEEIIKEAQNTFVHEPLKLTALVPDVPQCITPTSSTHSELNPPRKTVFAMEINVTKNLLTGESTVLSAASVPTEDLNRHTGLKVFDDGRKCVYALNPAERSTDKSCVSELSASEVEHLLRSASAHRHIKTPNYQQNHHRKDSTLYRHHQDGVRHQQGQFGFSTNEPADFGFKEAAHRRLQEQNNLHHNTDDRRSYHLTNCVNEFRSANKSNKGLNRTNVGQANGFHTPKSHDLNVLYPCQAELRYTPPNDVPLRDYTSVDDRELYGSDSPSALSHDGTPATALYSSATLCRKVPSPLFGDDVPYTILNSVSTTEPITAIFMGFQTAQDDSGQVQDFQDSLRAELVVIDDEDKKPPSCPTGRGANGDVGQAAGDRWTGRGVASGMRRMKSKHKACCAVC